MEPARDPACDRANARPKHTRAQLMRAIEMHLDLRIGMKSVKDQDRSPVTRLHGEDGVADSIYADVGKCLGAGRAEFLQFANSRSSAH